MGPGETFAFIFFMIFGFSGFNALLKHRQKMAEIKMRTIQNTDTATLAAMEQLRDELRQLRDTTMRYDMSFDAALTRLEERVERVETRSYAKAVAEDPLARLRTEQ